MCVILIEGTTKLSQTAMALKPVLLVLEPKQPNHIPISYYHLNPNRKTTQMTTLQSINITRRAATTIIATTSILLAGETISRSQTAEAFEFDFRMTVPDQTFEEATSVIQFHAQDLLQVKELFENSEPESWKEAQKALRKRSSLLKQDMYTIIQGKPGQERPQLSKLYSTLFNNATRLDYAARDKDEASVRECLDNIVVALKDFLSRI